jgi:hypothetical protein
MNGYRCAQQEDELDDCNPLCIHLNQSYDGVNEYLSDDKYQWRCLK